MFHEKLSRAEFEMDRRTWIAGAMGNGRHGEWLAVSGRRGASAAWIDAHSHIWTRDVDHFPLAKGTRLEDLSPPSFTVEELLHVARANDVGRIVLIQHHPFHGWDNSYVLDAADRYPDTFRVVAMVDSFSNEPGQQMIGLLKQHVTGFRINPQIYGRRWLEGGMPEMWSTAAKTGQKYLLLDQSNRLASH